MKSILLRILLVWIAVTTLLLILNGRSNVPTYRIEEGKRRMATSLLEERGGGGGEVVVEEGEEKGVGGVRMDDGDQFPSMNIVGKLPTNAVQEFIVLNRPDLRFDDNDDEEEEEEKEKKKGKERDDVTYIFASNYYGKSEVFSARRGRGGRVIVKSVCKLDTHWFTHFIHSLTHSPTHSLSNSLTHSLTHSAPTMHSGCPISKRRGVVGTKG